MAALGIRFNGVRRGGCGKRHKLPHGPHLAGVVRLNRLRPPMGNRLMVCAALSFFALIGFMGLVSRGADFDSWGDRMFNALMLGFSLLAVWRAWTVALSIQECQLIIRGFARTRRIELRDIRSVEAVRSDWLFNWILCVRTADGQQHFFEDVRDYPWRTGRERMQAAAVWLELEAHRARAG